jgi:hypothetical protein
LGNRPTRDGLEDWVARFKEDFPAVALPDNLTIQVLQVGVNPPEGARLLRNPVKQA